MLQVSAPYAMQMASDNQRPIYIIEIAWNDGQAGVEGINDVYFMSADISDIAGVPANIQGRVYPLLIHESISAVTEQIDEKNGTSSIGTLKFALLDYKGIVSDIFRKAESDTGQSMRRQRVELYAMFEGMSWVDKLKLRTMHIYDAEYDSVKGVYHITAQSVLKWMKKEIFIPQVAQLSIDITATDTVIPLNDVGLFNAVTRHSSYGPGLKGFIKIDDEIIMWDVKHPLRNELVVAQNGRGMFGTAAAAHTANSDVSEVCVLKGNPIEIAMRVMMSGGPTKNAWNTLPAHWGLGLDALNIDLAAWKGLGATATGWDLTVQNHNETGIQFEFVFSSPIEGKVFIEREILRNIGAFGRILGDGRYSCKQYTVTAQPMLDVNGNVVGAATVLTEDDLVKWSNVKANMNKMAWALDVAHHPTPRDSTDMALRIRWLDYKAKARHGDSNIITYNVRGVSDINTARSIAGLFTNLQARFSSPPVEMTVTALPKWHTLEVGDEIVLDLKSVQDIFVTDLKWTANTQYINGARIFTPAGVYVALDAVGSTNASVVNVSGATEPTWGADVVNDPGGFLWVKHDGHLARAFEITAVSLDVRSGNVKLSLLSQQEVPTWSVIGYTPGAPGTPGGGGGGAGGGGNVPPGTAAQSAYHKNCYIRGVNLALMADWSVVNGVLSPNKATVLYNNEYYYDGPIKIDKTVVIHGTVKIFSTQSITFTATGKIDGYGKGQMGGKGTFVNPATGKRIPSNTKGWYGSWNNTGGQAGYIGKGGDGGGLRYVGVVYGKAARGGRRLHGPKFRPIITGAKPVNGQFQRLGGIPNMLAGAGGGSGGAARYFGSIGGSHPTRGGHGGNGGAGLVLCAPALINIDNGIIDLRGKPGGHGFIKQNPSLSAAAGGGGGGGGTLLLIYEILNGPPATTFTRFDVRGGAPGAHQYGYGQIKMAPQPRPGLDGAVIEIGIN